ncbi:MAG: hypothetical protein J5545_09275 [Bacteroidaceae bacterium]|nr:hypothetical protein [Bacteroidaceae bacterium]
MKKVISLILFLLAVIMVHAQRDENFKYMRGSLCMMMVEHPTLLYNKEVESVFKAMPIPERFNSHDLGVRTIRFFNDDDQLKNIQLFGQKQQLAKRLVSKWFDRKKETGAFDTELLRERGHYSATKIDVRLAEQQQRATAILEDLGENLIHHTYWVVNDIQYVNQGNFLGSIKDVAVVGSSLMGTASDVKHSFTDKGTSQSGKDKRNEAAANEVLGFMDKFKGFRLKVTSYLFRLKWDEEVANNFYISYYTETPDEEPDKVKAFQTDTDLFQLEYVGSVENTSTKMSYAGTKTEEDIVRKVCTRALDKNLADLQHEYADFRIKAPLVSSEPLKAYIGMKEDVTEKSRFEVLEVVKDEEGRTSYKRVGVIRPVKGKIWDNRYMADAEGSAESQLDGTLFERVSGSDFLPGYLIRETK